MTRTVHADAAFSKYSEAGAYHWREISNHPVAHNAFTAERYRRVIDAMQPLAGARVLDYGCGDGAMLAMCARRAPVVHTLVGFDPNDGAVVLARQMLGAHHIAAEIVQRLDQFEDGFFDRVACSEVIEHASSPEALIGEVARLCAPGGRAVFTTPVRLAEIPEDPNHVREWFPSEFRRLFDAGPLKVVDHTLIVPVAAVEVYFWRPPMFGRVPVFRFLCNLLSIGAGVNALSWLRLRSRLFMTQMITAEKRP